MAISTPKRSRAVDASAGARVPAPTKGKASRGAVLKNPETKHQMTLEVKNWIDQAMSLINHLRGEVERLKVENRDLKAYKKWAEHRILRSDHE